MEQRATSLGCTQGRKRVFLGLLCLLQLFVDSVESWTYFTDYKYNWMLGIENREMKCRAIDDRRKINEILHNEPQNVRYMDSLMLKEMIFNCYQRFSRPDIYATTPNPIKGFIKDTIKFPGTKWCGPGTNANSFDDLGSNREVDLCCREHDHCPVSLTPGSCHNEVCNPSASTISHCGCDEQFRQCLYKVNSKSADAIGSLYFNLGGVQCLEDRCFFKDYECPTHLDRPPPYRREERVIGFFSGVLTQVFERFNN